MSCCCTMVAQTLRLPIDPMNQSENLKVNNIKKCEGKRLLFSKSENYTFCEIM